MLTVTSGKKKQEVSSNTSFSCSLSLMPVSVVAGLCLMPSLLHERLLLHSCSSRDVKHTCVLFFLSSFQPVPHPHECTSVYVYCMTQAAWISKHMLVGNEQIGDLFFFQGMFWKQLCKDCWCPSSDLVPTSCSSYVGAAHVLCAGSWHSRL